MKLVSNRKWNIQDPAVADKIKEWLLANGGREDTGLTSEHEIWRIRYSDATLTYYKKGTLFVTDSNDGALVEAGVPGDEHRLAQVDVVAHHGVEAGIGRAVLEALVDVGPQLGFAQLLDVQHRDIGHGVLRGRTTEG